MGRSLRHSVTQGVRPREPILCLAKPKPGKDSSGSMSLWRLWKQAIFGNYKPRGDPAAADCVLAFSFGRVEGQAGREPGSSNEDLADFALSAGCGRPLILQGEIADAYLTRTSGNVVFRIEQPWNTRKHFDTRHVAVLAFEVMIAHGWRSALIVAHPNHLPRAEAVCRRLGIVTVVSSGLRSIRFCSNSSQRWTRCRRNWILRETLAIPYYRIRGWLDLSA